MNKKRGGFTIENQNFIKEKEVESEQNTEKTGITKEEVREVLKQLKRR